MNIAKTTAFGCTVFNLNLKSKSMEAAATSKTSAGGITADLSEWTRPQISQFAQSICKLPYKVSETILPDVTGKELCGFGKMGFVVIRLGLPRTWTRSNGLLL